MVVDDTRGGNGLGLLITFLGLVVLVWMGLIFVCNPVIVPAPVLVENPVRVAEVSTTSRGATRAEVQAPVTSRSVVRIEQMAPIGQTQGTQSTQEYYIANFEFMTDEIDYATFLAMGVDSTAAGSSEWAGKPMPVDKVASLPLSDHAVKDHPERLPAAKIQQLLLSQWLLDQCTPRRAYVGCKGGWTQLFACQLRPAKLWALLVIGLKSEPTIVTRFVTSEAELNRIAHREGCSSPIEVP